MLSSVLVKDKEDTQVDSEARPMKDETFGEYRYKAKKQRDLSTCPNGNGVGWGGETKDIDMPGFFKKTVS